MGGSKRVESEQLFAEEFLEISVADFFYRNREIAGFSNPTRAMYSAIRELVENSLDACELYGAPPDIYTRVTLVEGALDTPSIYEIKIADNGSGMPPQHIPYALGQVLYGSKYKLRQTRGTFGLGGTMAILYGQITTNRPVRILSSTGDDIWEYELMIDIQRNKPIVLDERVRKNGDGWRGTVIEFTLEGDYPRAMPKVLEYFRQTAIVAPYANITFVDPRGRLFRFERATTAMPQPAREILPHPYGVDVETLRRIISATKCRDMLSLMTTHFHRVGEKTARKFLEYAGISPDRDPKTLSQDEIVALTSSMKSFEVFLPPDPSCLSPLGEELLRAGIEKELSPEFVAVKARRPSSYSGHPFIVEVGIAYGGSVPKTGSIVLYRFANRIPLLYDETSDVSWKVVYNMINWRHYKVRIGEDPVAVIVHICSTKIPYKTVGKEFIADIPEVEHEILNGVREVARKLSMFLSRKRVIEREQRRLDIFSKYLPKIARFATELSGKKKPPNVEPLLRSVRKYGAEE